MINNYLRTIKPYSASSAYLSRPSLERPPPLQKRNKYTIFALLLAKATYKTLRQTFKTIHDRDKYIAAMLEKISKIS